MEFVSSVTVSNFTNNEDYAFFTVFLPFDFQYPSSVEEFVALETLVIFDFLKRNKGSCVQQVHNDIWVAAG